MRLSSSMKAAVSAKFAEAGRVSTQRRSDRKSTRLNSSHTVISYAVFCLKKKKKKTSAAQRASQYRERLTARICALQREKPADHDHGTPPQNHPARDQRSAQNRLVGTQRA